MNKPPGVKLTSVSIGAAPARQDPTQIASADLAVIFFGEVSPENVAAVQEMFGQDGIAAVAEIAASTIGWNRGELLGMICRGWQSPVSMLPTVQLLSLLDVTESFRAFLAQTIGRQHPDTVMRFAPFYRAVCGLQHGEADNG